MIRADDCITLILKEIPEFSAHWADHLNYWNDDQPGLCINFSAFSHFTIELIQKKQENVLKRIFDLVERLMVEGDQTVQEAVATCFVEDLINAVPDEIDSRTFVHLLGDETRDYVKGWDDFTGVKTPGLYSDDH